MRVRSAGLVVAATLVVVGVHASGFAAPGDGVKLAGACRPGEFSMFCMYPPDPVFPLLLTKTAGNLAQMTWPDQGDAYAHDIMRGSLTLLSETRGDFAIATERCLINDSDARTFEDSDNPVAGDGFWYVLRTDQVYGCPDYGGGSYNWGVRQAGDRNSEIDTSGRDCTCILYCCLSNGSCSP